MGRFRRSENGYCMTARPKKRKANEQPGAPRKKQPEPPLPSPPVLSPSLSPPRERTREQRPAPQQPYSSDPFLQSANERCRTSGLVTPFHILPNRFRTLSHVELKYTEPSGDVRPCVLVNAPDHRSPDTRVTVGLERKRQGTEKLGYGAYGQVVTVPPFKAVAKIVIASPEPSQLQMPAVMMDEAIVGIRMCSPNVVPILRSYFCPHLTNNSKVAAVHIMPRMSEGSLYDMNRRNALTVPILHCAEYDMLQALTYIHARGLMHKDIKPANILCDSLPARGDDVPYIFKMGDLGATSNNPNQMLAGTYQYLAPECLGTQMQLPASDVWALFTSMWELLFGVPMVAVFPGKVGRERGEEWAEVTKDSKKFLGFVVRTVYDFFGGGINPIDGFNAMNQGNLKGENNRPLSNPKFKELFEYHRVSVLSSENPMVRTWLDNFQFIMMPEVNKRPPAAMLLKLPFYRDVPPLPQYIPPPDTSGLTRGIAVDDSYLSTWYLEAGERWEPDMLLERTPIGGEFASIKYPKVGLKELTPPFQQRLHRRQKPAKFVGPQQLLAGGAEYYLFDWENGYLLLSLILTIQPQGKDFVQNVEAFCEQLLKISVRQTIVVPFVEYFIEILGNQCILHLVIKGTEWRQIGARAYTCSEAWNKLVAATVKMGLSVMSKPSNHISDIIMINCMWSETDGVPRLNLPVMFLKAIGESCLLKCMNGQSALIGRDKVFNRRVLLKTLERYNVPKHYCDVLTPLMTGPEDDWSCLTEHIKTLRVPNRFTMTEADLYPSKFSPRIRMPVFDTAV